MTEEIVVYVPYGHAGPFVPERLFEEFDPVTSLHVKQIKFRDQAGCDLSFVDGTSDLLALAYAAACSLGKRKRPNKENWVQIHDLAESAIKQTSKGFDFLNFADKTANGSQPIDLGSYAFGPLRIVYLHAHLQERDEEKKAREVTRLWSFLCLMWIDAALEHIREGNVSHAVQYAVRASEAFARSDPRTTLQEARSQIGKENKGKRKKDEVAEEVWRKIFSLWRERKDLPKYKKSTELARGILKKLGLVDSYEVGTLTKKFGKWARGVELPEK